MVHYARKEQSYFYVSALCLAHCVFLFLPSIIHIMNLPLSQAFSTGLLPDHTESGNEATQDLGTTKGCLEAVVVNASGTFHLTCKAIFEVAVNCGRAMV